MRIAGGVLAYLCFAWFVARFIARRLTIRVS